MGLRRRVPGARAIALAAAMVVLTLAVPTGAGRRDARRAGAGAGHQPARTPTTGPAGRPRGARCP